MISPTQYSSKGNSARVLSSLNSMRFQPRFCDVTLLVGDRRFPAQRFVLAAFSDYFRAMFQHDLREARDHDQIRLNDLDAESVEKILDFCYSSQIEVSQTNVESLLATARFLQVDEVKDYCCEFLELHTDVGNCLDVRQLARAFDCVQLVDASTQFIQYHFLDVVGTEAFLQLPVEELSDIVSLSKLRVESEKEVLEAVMRWTHHDDAVHRVSSLHRVLRHVRFPLLEPELVDVISRDDLVTSNAQVVALLDEARQFLALPKAERPRAQRWWSRPRHRGKKCVAGRTNVAPTATLTSTGELVAARDPHWYCYEFPHPIRILRVEFRWSCSAPLIIQLECSNDTRHWKLVSRSTVDRGGYWQPHACQVAVPRLYRFYRLYFALAFHKMNVDHGEAVRRWKMDARDVKMTEAVDEKVGPGLF